MRLQTKLILLFAFSLIFITGMKADEKIVTVGIYENAPKVFTSESGKPSGIFIDIIEYIAKIEGWKLYYKSGTWAEGLSRLEKGEIDLMPDVAYTADREKIFSFPKESVLSSWSQVYTRKGSGIRSLMNLDGKKIAVLQGSVQQEAFVRLSEGFELKITLIPVPDYQKAFEMVAKNEVDAVISNNFYGLMHTKEFGLEDSAVIFSPSRLMFAAPKNAPVYLLDAIDRHLTDLKKDTQSVYYRSLKQWTSEDIRFKLPAWIQILFLIVGVTLVMSLLGSFVLKYQVNSRTRELKKINMEMEQRIIERTSRLNETNVKLSSEIEERMKIEKILIHSEAKYRDLVENANSMILRWSRTGSITFINKFAQQFFGYSEEEIIGKNIMGTLVPISKLSDQDNMFLITDVFSNPESYVLNENENIRKNGDRVWISWTNRPFVNERGEVTEILSVGNDITDRKNAEDLLKKTLVELTAAKERAEEADRLKSAFLSTMSHELRTPLNSIIGFTGIILQEMVGALNDEQKKQLNMVRGSAQHLLSLINDVLDISKIEAGQLQLVYETYNICMLMEKVVESTKPIAGKKGLEIEYSINPGIETVNGDRRRVEQVLLNLVGNAIKFSEKGVIKIECEPEGNDITIRIIDNGIGIKSEDIDSLFKAFRQIDSGITRKYEGTGLGLSICKKLVELMGGKIWVTSIPGTGSTFGFSIPFEKVGQI